MYNLYFWVSPTYDFCQRLYFWVQLSKARTRPLPKLVSTGPPGFVCWCTFQILGMSGSEDRSGGDNSIQFINFGRVGEKSFKEWRQKIGVEGWVTTIF